MNKAIFVEGSDTTMLPKAAVFAYKIIFRTQGIAMDASQILFGW